MSPRALLLLLPILGATGGVLGVACTDETPDTTSTESPPVPAASTPSSDAGSSGATGDEDSGRSSFTPPPTCTSFTYSDWSACHYDGIQTRTVVATVPPDCYGGGPVLKQSCEFTVPSDGPGLYEAYCAGCHGNGKKGSSATAIKSAIDSNRGGMGVLSSLTTEQIALIASVK